MRGNSDTGLDGPPSYVRIIFEGTLDDAEEESKEGGKKHVSMPRDGVTLKGQVNFEVRLKNNEVRIWGPINMAKSKL